MTRNEPFDLVVGDGVVRGTLRAPGEGGARPCVLFRCGLWGSVDDPVGVVAGLGSAGAS